MNVKVPLVQGLRGTTIVTEVCLPGERVPLDGIKVTPLKLLLAVQVRLPFEVGVSPTFVKQVQPPWLAVHPPPFAGNKLVGVRLKLFPG